MSAQLLPVESTPSGPLEQTVPFVFDSGDVFTDQGNYQRLVVYGRGFDPVQDADPLNDYYVIFASATVQAKGDGWCIGDGRPLVQPTPSQIVGVSVFDGATILPDFRPVNGDHGDATGTFGLDLSINIPPKAPIITAGLSWEQYIFQWNLAVTASTTSQLTWQATKGLPLIPTCDTSVWSWGYAFVVKVAENTYPRIYASLIGGFIKPAQLSCPGNTGPPPICVDAGLASIYHEFRLPPRIYFQTNPVIGSIVLNGSQFVNGERSVLPVGNYTAVAMSSEDYVFDHWEVSGGASFRTLPNDPGETGNPTMINFTGNGVLKAVFAAKLTFLTDPPDKGLISIAPTVGGECGSGHPNGDWTYISSLPPDGDGSVVLCANLPLGWAGEWSIDHWSSTASLAYSPNPNSNYWVIHMTGPSTIKVWFSRNSNIDVEAVLWQPGTGFCCPFTPGNGTIGSIQLLGEDVTNRQIYVPPGYCCIRPLAIPSEGYAFDHWVTSGLSLVTGITCCPQDMKSNPAVFSVNSQGPYSLYAVFSTKVTFATYPSGTGSIGWGGCGPNYPNHPDGDWTYIPNLGNKTTICANAPAGYKFDHWTITAGSLTASYNSSTTITFSLVPTVIKAWFLNNLTTTPPSAPSTPSSLVATGQYGLVDLAWNPPLFGGGSQVTSYQIYRGNSFGSLSLLASVGNQLWYQDTSVINGQIYYYRVTAVNSAGEGPSSNTDWAKPGIDRITLAPDPRSVLIGAQVQFSAFATAESGEIIQGVSFSWTTSVPGASITSAGLFKAGTVIGTFTEEVSASVAGVNGYATVMVQAPPGTRSGTAGLSFDSLGPWTWALIPGATAAVVGVLAVVVYRKKTHRPSSKRP